VLLDDYQRAGSAPIDVHALGVDFMATGCRTYMSRRVRPGGVGREVRGQDASRGDAMRVSFHAYNNEQAVEAAMDALRAEEALLARVDARVGLIGRASLCAVARARKEAALRLVRARPGC